MIQSAYNKPVEKIAPKAEQLPKSASVSSKSSSPKPKDIESELEKEDFESELKAAGAEIEESSESEVKEVKVSADKKLEKPSRLVNPEALEENPLHPTMFDPEMTMDVEKAIKPKSAQGVVPKMTDEQVLKLAQGEIPQLDASGAEVQAVTEGDLEKELGNALIKDPKALKGAPVQGEAQLMSVDDFVAQKAAAPKKPVGINAYGMQKPQQKMAMENGLKQTQMVNDATAQQGLEARNGGMNSQQFILNMQSENGTAKANEASGPQKVFDMNQVKSGNADQILSQITDYIVQAKASKEPSVSMRMNHDELGMIDITVAKTSQFNMEAVAINIGTHSLEGKNFFQQNSKDLFTHLSNTGINVADLKVDTPSQSSKGEFDMNGGSRQGQSGAEKQFGSESNQRRHDSDRRQDLWKLLDDEAA